MYRSGSQSRVAEEYYTHAPPPSSKPPPLSIRPQYLEAQDLLPTYDSASILVDKKDKYRTKFVDNAVHVIPLVLLICGLILWLFSHPDVDMGMKLDPIATKIEGLTIEGDIDSDSDGTQTGFLPVNVEETDTTKQLMKKFPKGIK
ncbi:unnamed protein product [Rhodiola kirilowii]